MLFLNVNFIFFSKKNYERRYIIRFFGKKKNESHTPSAGVFRADTMPRVDTENTDGKKLDLVLKDKSYIDHLNAINTLPMETDAQQMTQDARDMLAGRRVIRTYRDFMRSADFFAKTDVRRADKIDSIVQSMWPFLAEGKNGKMIDVARTVRFFENSLHSYISVGPDSDSAIKDVSEIPILSAAFRQSLEKINHDLDLTK